MILITDIENYKLRCTDGVSEHNSSCKFCIISAPCSCAFQTENILLPALLSDCEPNTQIESKFLVNLKNLYSFFNESKLISFDGGTLLNHPVNISLPDFKFNQDNGTNLHEQMVKIDMEKLAEEIKRDKQIFYSRQDEMQYRLGEIQGPISIDFNNWKDISLLCLITLTTRITILTIYPMCEISRLLLIISAVHTAEAIENVSHPSSLIYGERDIIESIVVNPLPNATAPFNFQIDLEYRSTTAQIFLTMVTVVVLLAILAKHCRKSHRNKRIFGCQLFFSLSSESESILIPSQVFDDIAKNYRFACELFIMDMHVSRCLKLNLIVQWDVEICHHASGTAIQFNDKIAISFQQAWVVHRILDTKKYIVKVLMRNENNNLEPIDLTQKINLKQLMCASASAPNENEGPEKMDHGNANTLYPSLGWKCNQQDFRWLITTSVSLTGI